MSSIPFDLVASNVDALGDNDDKGGGEPIETSQGGGYGSHGSLPTD